MIIIVEECRSWIVDIYHLQIQYRSMTSSVILEEWVYTIFSSDNSILYQNNLLYE